MKIDEIFKELAEYTRLSEEAAAHVEALKDQIKAYMTQTGTDELTGREHKATWRPVVSNRVDTSALKRDMPQIATQFTKAVETKRFTFV